MSETFAITEITVTSSAKWPHPHEEYSNLSSSVSITAKIHLDKGVELITTALQAVADEQVKRHRIESKKRLDQWQKIKAYQQAQRWGDSVGDAHRAELSKRKTEAESAASYLDIDLETFDEDDIPF